MHPDGSEQMELFKEDGAYLISLDGPSVEDKENKKTRFASLRHVNKTMQTHKIEKSQNGSGGCLAAVHQRSNWIVLVVAAVAPGSSRSTNTKVIASIRKCAAREAALSFVLVTLIVGYYDKAADTWYVKGKIATMEFDKHYTTVTDRFEVIGTGDAKIKLGLESEG